MSDHMMMRQWKCAKRDKRKKRALEESESPSSKPPDPLLAVVYIRPRYASLLKEQWKGGKLYNTKVEIRKQGEQHTIFSERRRRARLNWPSI